MNIQYSVKKYDERLQKMLGSSVKPEPWLHIAVFVNGNNRTFERTKNSDDKERVHYAIFVWDTRKVIEAKSIEDDKLPKYQYLLSYCTFIRGRNAVFHAKKAKDFGQPLIGSGETVKLLNKQYFNK